MSTTTPEIAAMGNKLGTPMKSFEDSDFVVVFTGEGASACVISGWENVLNHLDREATNGTPEESYRNQDWTGIHNVDNWTTFNGAWDCLDDRFQFSEDVGECSYLTITRLTPNTELPSPEPATPTSAANEEPKFQIEVGKFYKNRKGEKIGPVTRNEGYPGNGPHEFFAGCYYRMGNGQIWQSGDQDVEDLIEEWPSPTPAMGEGRGAETARNDKPAIDVGEGHEQVTDGTAVIDDDIQCHALNSDGTLDLKHGRWTPPHGLKGHKVGRHFTRLAFRRRIPAAPPEAPYIPQVDIVRHEREELRKAVETLRTNLIETTAKLETETKGFTSLAGLVTDRNKELTVENEQLRLASDAAQKELAELRLQVTGLEKANGVLLANTMKPLQPPSEKDNVFMDEIFRIGKERNDARAERDRLNAELLGLYELLGAKDYNEALSEIAKRDAQLAAARQPGEWESDWSKLPKERSIGWIKREDGKVVTALFNTELGKQVCHYAPGLDEVNICFSFQDLKGTKFSLITQQPPAPASIQSEEPKWETPTTARNEVFVCNVADDWLETPRKLLFIREPECSHRFVCESANDPSSVTAWKHARVRA